MQNIRFVLQYHNYGVIVEGTLIKKCTIESSLLLEKHNVNDMRILIKIVLLSNNNSYIPSEFETVTLQTVVIDTAFNRI